MLVSYSASHRNKAVVKVVLDSLDSFVSSRQFHRRLRRDGSRKGKSAQPRIRRSVKEIYKCLGPVYFRRAYRMSYQSFWILHSKLKPGILEAMERPEEDFAINSSSPPVPNGPITTSVRLACALRYFAGGSIYDIMGKYGISHTEVLNSVWYVVEAINSLAEFFIEYPSDPI